MSEQKRKQDRARRRPRSVEDRRRPRRSARGQGRRGWLRGGLAVLVGVLVTVAVVEVVRWVGQSPALAIASVEVAGHHRASPEALRRLAGISIGASRWSVRAGAARARVISHPWVEQASVDLVSIDRVQISVVEHQPVALVALGNLYFVNVDGRLFKRYSPGEAVDLPVVTGLDRARVEAADPEQTDLLMAALSVVTAWPTETLGRLAEVNVNEAFGLTVVLVEDGLTVAFGQHGVTNQLERLARVRSALEDRGLRAHRIDLSATRRANRVTVRLARGGESVSPGAPKATRRM